MSSLGVLSKRLREVENQAKLLRSEVTSLNATRRDVVLSETAPNRSQEILRQRQGEQSYDISSNSQGRARSSNQLLQASKPASLFPDLIDQVTQKIGDLQSSIKKRRELHLQKQTLITIQNKFESDIQRIEAEYDKLSEAFNTSNASTKSKFVQSIEENNELKNELRELVEMYHERQLLQGQLSNQSHELWRLSSLMQDTVGAQEQKQKALDSLIEKKAKLEEMRNKRIHLECAVKTKNSFLQRKPPSQTEEELLKSATNDFRVALQALDREDDMLKSNDAAIRHRAMQIAKTQKRLELIGEAVAGDKLDSEERVDVEVVDRLVSDIDALYVVKAEVSVQMEKLDGELEKIEYKVGAIQRAILGAQKELDFVKSSHLRKIRLLRKEAGCEHKLNSCNISLLEKEVATLRKRVSNRRRTLKCHPNTHTGQLTKA